MITDVVAFYKGGVSNEYAERMPLSKLNRYNVHANRINQATRNEINK